MVGGDDVGSSSSSPRAFLTDDSPQKTTSVSEGSKNTYLKDPAPASAVVRKRCDISSSLNSALVG